MHRSMHRSTHHSMHQLSRRLLTLIGRLTAAAALLGYPLVGPPALRAQPVHVTEGLKGSIVGEARDLLTGALVPNAWLTAERMPGNPGEGNASARSDSAGRFTFDSLPPGAYLLRTRVLRAELGSALLPVHVRPGERTYVPVFLPPPGFDPTTRAARLQEAQAQWSKWRWDGPTAYYLTVSWECPCIGTGAVGSWELEVRPGGTTVRRRPSEHAVPPPAVIVNVDSVFAWLTDQLRDPGRIVDVQYHPTLGYPVDVHTNTHGLFLHGWLRVRIDRVERLQGDQ